MSLKISEFFYSIQSEGPLAGTPAFFIRTAGCNLGKQVCSFCDTDYRYRYSMTPKQLIDKLNRITDHCFGGPTTVVITGGEPFLQKELPVLVSMLRDYHYLVQIETNGTVVPEIIDHELHGAIIVCSPKTENTFPGIERFVSAWKYVVGTDTVINENTGTPKYLYYPTLKLAGTQSVFYLQPRDDQDPVLNERNNKRVIGLCLKYNLKLSLQYHKLMKVR